MASNIWLNQNIPEFLFKVLSIFKPKFRNLPKNRSRNASKARNQSPRKECQKDDCTPNGNASIQPSHQLPFSQQASGTIINGHSDCPQSDTASVNVMHLPSEHEEVQAPQPLRAFGDRERTEMRYNEAIKQLEECLAVRASSYETLQVPKFDEIRQDNQISRLRDKIDEMLQTRKSPPNTNILVRRIFAAMVPFSKSLLVVAVQSQPAPFGLLFAGVLLLISVTRY
jgi:hypothetical protein